MTSFLLQLCAASASVRLFLDQSRLIHRGRTPIVVSSSSRSTSPPSRLFRQRRWRCAQPSLYRRKSRLSLSSSPSRRLLCSASLSIDFAARLSSVCVVTDAAGASAESPKNPKPTLYRLNAVDRAALEHLVIISSASSPGRFRATMEAPRHRPSRSHANSAAAHTASTSSDIQQPPVPVSTPPMAAATPSSTPGGSFEDLETRPSRSASTASRTNRLSLTLPIALPSAYPSRPMPASATTGSFPATPMDVNSNSGLATPTDPADFITAIAAQERRVLELREELVRAEAGLTKLKRQWANYEVQRKRAEIRRTEPLRALNGRPPSTTIGAGSAPFQPTAAAAAVAGEHASSAVSDSGGLSRDADVDRKKALLLSTQQQLAGSGSGGSGSSTPPQSRRRVFRGGHARTLSLLSPTKTSASDGFSVHEDSQPEDDDVHKSPRSQGSDSPFYQNIQQLGRYAPISAANLSKRASWAPQSVHQVNNFKQVAGDLTATLWTFVEDLRQATVGDEPIIGNGSSSGGGSSFGQAMRNIDGNSRTTGNAMSASASAPSLISSGSAGFDDSQQDTIRASSNAGNRTHVAKAFADSGAQSQSQGQSTPSPVSRYKGSGRSKATTKSETAQTKQFSWTPLSVDSLDDSDWASWDTPTVKSPRWSGSTVNGDLEQVGETTPSRKKSVSGQTSVANSPSTGGESGWPAAFNRLTPGNIKRTATDLMKEFERSLTSPVSTPLDEAIKRDTLL